MINNNDIIKAIDSINRVQLGNHQREMFLKNNETNYSDNTFGDILKREQDKLEQIEMLKRQRNFLTSLQLEEEKNITKKK